MKRIVTGGLAPDDVRATLIDYAKQGLMLQGGYKPKQMSVTPVTTLIARPLAMLRNKPQFHMNAGYFDPMVEWLVEMGMKFDSQPIIRHFQVDNVTQTQIYIHDIQIFVNELRKYVQILDKRYEEGAKYD